MAGLVRLAPVIVSNGVTEMGHISSNKSLAQLTEMKAKELTELDRLLSECEYLERKLKLNAECIDFMKFSLQRREYQIAENAHLVGPWSVGFYSHDAD